MGGGSKIQILKKLQYCTAEFVRDVNVCNMDVWRYGRMIWDGCEGWMEEAGGGGSKSTGYLS